MNAETIKKQYKNMTKRLIDSWGKTQWERLSEDYRDAMIAREILAFMAAQAVEKYEPAVEVIDALNKLRAGIEE